ncbi:hypothetical protein AVEN_131469-1 [Araneus ventricosus]|uniref:Peptidase A2 domain-containing protein n=1 Tax=Araneus ventricosus TaxID=182803 RepID=A0A4Y2F0T7_ARAVE|nr:hypothetical protein AVEN_131469-1 [Araneus ventricosus]
MFSAFDAEISPRKNCKFSPSFGDEAIRDRIVCGILYKRVSEKLQLEADLTLEKAINISRQAEIIKKQQPFVTSHENKTPNSADKITAKQIPKFIPEKGKQIVYSKPEIQRSRNGNKTQISKFRENCSKTETQCKWCGNSKIHSKEKFTAKNAICNACKKKGNYSRVCRSHIKVNAPTEENISSYLGNLKNSSSEDKWRVNVLVDNKLLHFKIDTGADIALIS